MKRIFIPLAAALALAVPAIGSASGTTTIKLGKTNLGKLIENKGGFVLYMFTRDGKNKDTCYNLKSSFGSCRSIWPPVIDKGKLVAGPGVKKSLLGTIKLPNGKKQVTYNGHALYLYSGASGPGDTSYVGFNEFGGNWDALNAAGHKVK